VIALPFRTDPEVRAALPQAIAHLEGGGLLGHPTETVYGVGGRPVEEDIAAVEALKRRAGGKPQLLLVDGLPMVEALGLCVEGPARALADAFWPGPVTLVLPGGGASLPESLRGASGGIAVRWTSHPGMRALLTERGGPITSTSANAAGAPTATSVTEVTDLFPEAVSGGRLMLLDGGRLPGAPSSTVVDCTAGSVRIVREGAVPRHAVLSALGGAT
jgi:L-threonylcarbamoyladenylate synthase